jgi:hypothetical protein
MSARRGWHDVKGSGLRPGHILPALPTGAYSNFAKEKPGENREKNWEKG